MDKNVAMSKLTELMSLKIASVISGNNEGVVYVFDEIAILDTLERSFPLTSSELEIEFDVKASHVFLSVDVRTSFPSNVAGVRCKLPTKKFINIGICDELIDDHRDIIDFIINNTINITYDMETREELKSRCRDMISLYRL